MASTGTLGRARAHQGLNGHKFQEDDLTCVLRDKAPSLPRAPECPCTDARWPQLGFPESRSSVMADSLPRKLESMVKALALWIREGGLAWTPTAEVEKRTPPPPSSLGKATAPTKGRPRHLRSDCPLNSPNCGLCSRRAWKRRGICSSRKPQDNGEAAQPSINWKPPRGPRRQ